MKIINAMFGKGKGGIEQAFVDYSRVLINLGYETTSIIHPNSEVKKLLEREKIPFIEIKNKGDWDVFAIVQLKKLVKKTYPDLAFCHGNRAINLFRKSKACKVVGIAHNYNIKRFGKLEAVITVSKRLKKEVELLGVKKVFHIPNMIEVPSLVSEKKFHNPLMIGSMSRLVPEKGLENLIEAISILRRQTLTKIKIKIAGTGHLKKELEQQAKNLNLQDDVEFLGWISDKQKEKFFNDIDIFCFPSVKEAFGIVILEAFANGVPVVSTDSEGPSEIIKNERNGIIVAKNTPEELALGVKSLIAAPKKAREIGIEGYKTVKENYSVEAVTNKLNDVIKQLV